MRRLIIAGLCLAAIATGAGLAQEAPATDDNASNAAAPEGAALQRSLEQRALRIPASDLAAALSAAKDGRTNRARVLPSRPDWAAVRAELQRTADEDAAREEEPEAQEETKTRRLRPPPPPGLRAFVAKRLPKVDQAESDRVRIPVLAPAHPDVRDKLKLYGLEHSYTATAPIDDQANLSISGSCSKVIGGAPGTIAFRRQLFKNRPRLLPGLRSNYLISRNDYGVDLSFSLFSCGYVLTLECQDIDKDERCAKDDYITTLAKSMLLVNPERAEEE